MITLKMYAIEKKYYNYLKPYHEKKQLHFITKYPVLKKNFK